MKGHAKPCLLTDAVSVCTCGLKRVGVCGPCNLDKCTCAVDKIVKNLRTLAETWERQGVNETHCRTGRARRERGQECIWGLRALAFDIEKDTRK